jgi:peptide-methionine (R)-S-oxide reductase
MKTLYLFMIIPFFLSCQETKKINNYKVSKTDSEWRKMLPRLSYNVLRKSFTEPAFSSNLNFNKKSGYYACMGCKNPLYSSENKYESGSGWPSFDREIRNNIEFDVDYKIGYPRTELKCSNCGGHLGHMFNDGPKETTGERHCINGAALIFIEK